MARTESEQLVFSVEARIAAMEKQMARAGRTVDTTFTGMERRSRRAAQNMEKEMASGAARVGSVMKNFGKGLFAGVVAGGVAGIAAQIGDIARSMASVGDEAKRAGVSVQAFQEWKFVAEQNRIGIDQMTDGLKELSLRADEFATTGKGAASEAFARLGYSAADVAEKLKDPSKLMLEMIGRMQRLNSDAARIRIADEIFGGSAGERFVELLNQGEAGIRKTIDRAHELGAVMDADMIKKAAELDRRFNEIATSVGSTLKSAIVSAADSLSEFIDGFRAFENQQNRTLTSKVSDIDRQRLDLENQILDLRQKQGEQTGVYARHEVRMLEGQVSALEDQRKALADEGARIEAILQGRRTDAMARNTSREWTPPAITPPGGGGGSKRDASAAATEREAEAVRRLIAELEEELRLVGASSMEKEIASTLRRANVDAASAEGQQIAALVTEIERETEALEKNRQAQEARTQAISNMFDMGGDALMSIVDGSMKAEDAVKRLAIQLALAAAQSALLGSGPFGGLFGGGGPNFSALSASGRYLFSEGGYTGPGGRNAPAGIVHRGEVVWSQTDVQRAGGVGVVEAMRRGVQGYSSGGPVAISSPVPTPVMPSLVSRGAPGNTNVHFSMAVTVSGSGDKELEARLQKATEIQMNEALRVYDREVLPVRVNHIANDPYARG